MIRPFAVLAAALALMFASVAPLVAADTGEPEDCRPERGIHRPIRAQLHFVGIKDDGREVRGPGWNANRLEDLKIVVTWKRLNDNHMARLILRAPDGAQYQTFRMPLTKESDEAPIETMVPVAGSWITRTPLWGTWCAEVFLDDDPEPLAAKRFTIAAPRR